MFARYRVHSVASCLLGIKLAECRVCLVSCLIGIKLAECRVCCVSCVLCIMFDGYSV